MIKIGIASTGEKKSNAKDRFVLWVAEDGVTKQRLAKIHNIIVRAFEEKGISWELTNGFEDA